MYSEFRARTDFGIKEKLKHYLIEEVDKIVQRWQNVLYNKHKCLGFYKTLDFNN